MKNKYALFTNDVETTSIWFNDLRDDTGKLVLEKGMPILLESYAKYNIKTTFYFTAYIAELYPQIVQMILPYGHEVGSHGKSHTKENGFDVMPYEKQKRHLEYSKKFLEDISGQEVISFRAPALRVNNDTARALVETGFRIDSSIAAQRFDFGLSFGTIKKMKWLAAKRLPYKTNPDNLFKRGSGPIVEIPLSALIMPIAGTTLRIFPATTKLMQRVLHYESIINGKPFVFGTHPNEFINEENIVSSKSVNRRSRNLLQYILTDVIRRTLKVKNLGSQAVPIYEDLIKFYIERNYRCCTIREFCEENSLI